jgi:glucokinase
LYRHRLPDYRRLGGDDQPYLGFLYRRDEANLGFAHLEIINDFTAVSMAIPMLKAEHLIQFGGSAPVAGKPIAVYGAGTGLGVAHLVHVDKRWVSLPGEGGHVDFAPNSEEEGLFWKSCAPSWGMFPQNACSPVPGWSICIARL